MEAGKMIKKYFGVLVISFNLANAALCQEYNARLLQEYADDFSRKLCSHTPIRVEDIQEDLNFVYKPDTLKTVASSFEMLQEKATLLLEDRSFATFFQTCKSIDDSGDEETQVSVRMLLNAVVEKHSVHFKRLQKLKKTKGEPRELTATPQLLGKADKTAPLDYLDALFGVKVY